MAAVPFPREIVAPANDAGDFGRPRADDILLPFTDTKIETAYHYWCAKAGTRAMPPRAEIDPAEIPKLLPDVMLVDVLPERRYRYRLVGTGNARGHLVNATGQYLDEVLAGTGFKAHVLGLYDQCVGARRPLYSEYLFRSPDDPPIERYSKVLFLPLSQDGITVNIVFVLRIVICADPATHEGQVLDTRPYRQVVHTLL